jgi:hypothetical protein
MRNSNQNKSADIKGDHMKSLIGEPLLLPGEDRAAYDGLLAGLTEAVRPTDGLEALWVSEAATKHWEVYRQRRHKRGFIAARRQAGLMSLLKPLVSYGAPFATDDGEETAGRLAWKYISGDAEAKREVDELLKQTQLSAEALDGEIMAVHIDTLARFDHLIWLAEKRRDACLREIEHHRMPFGRALRGAIAQVDRDEPQKTERRTEQNKAA